MGPLAIYQGSFSALMLLLTRTLSSSCVQERRMKGCARSSAALGRDNGSTFVHMAKKCWNSGECFCGSLSCGDPCVAM